MEQTTAGNKMNFGALVRRWGPLSLVLVAVGVALQQGWFPTLEQVAARRDDLLAFVDQRYVLALVSFFAVYAAVIALSIPGGALLTMVGGFLFGWMVAAPVVVFAATMGATVIFVIARTSLGAALAEKAGPRLGRLRDGFERDALSYLLFLRLVPLFPFWLVNLAPALLGMRLLPFVLGTFVGIIPGTVAFAFLGAGLDSVIAAQRAAYEACLERHGAGAPGRRGSCSFELDPGSLLTPEIIVAFTALGVVALIPAIARYVRSRRGRTTRG